MYDREKVRLPGSVRGRSYCAVTPIGNRGAGGAGAGRDAAAIWKPRVLIVADASAAGDDDEGSERSYVMAKRPPPSAWGGFAI